MFEVLCSTSGPTMIAKIGCQERRPRTQVGASTEAPRAIVALISPPLGTGATYQTVGQWRVGGMQTLQTP